jgi:hypothetical protein
VNISVVGTFLSANRVVVLIDCLIDWCEVARIHSHGNVTAVVQLEVARVGGCQNAHSVG